jgi:hypothetical protein
MALCRTPAVRWACDLAPAVAKFRSSQRLTRMGPLMHINEGNAVDKIVPVPALVDVATANLGTGCSAS